MFEGWDDYFLLVGSAAAALIGLLFVVVTLTAGRERSTIELGQRFYMTPIVADLGAILLLSGTVMAPALHEGVKGVLVTLAGIAGLAADVGIALGIRKLKLAEGTRGFDVTWYGVVPAIVSVALAGAGIGVLLHMAWAPVAVAAVLMALLLVCIHNAWDLVTFIAPLSTEDQP